MVAILIALASVIAYLEAANVHGTAKMDLLYPPAREAANVYNADVRPVPVYRFGLLIGGEER